MRPLSSAALRRGGWLLAGLFLGVAALLMWFEERLVFPAPRYPSGDWNPRDFVFEDVWFAADDGVRLHGWRLEHPQPRGEVIYFHGNADCVAYAGPAMDWLRTRYRVNVFVWDYRGYGRSGGRPDERGILADARAAQRWVVHRSGKAPGELVLMGRSLGGAVAIDLAAASGARALVLQNTFTSLPEVAAWHYPWLPVRRLMRTQFNALARIGAYAGPVLLSHADRDEVVPLAHGERLLAAAAGPKRLYVWPGESHNQPEPPEYDRVLEEFLQREAFAAR
jgi:fermentation-respiration switch protein FrsA (DUF1100 family)